MTVFLNGEFVPAERATVSVLDRGFLYGDGLFETMRVHRGQPFCWEAHLERFERGAAFLKIPLLFTREQLLAAAVKLIELNQLQEAVLRLMLSRGPGARGYSPRGANAPTTVMTLHPLPLPPASVRLLTSTLRVAAGDPFAPYKIANRLLHIMARAEAEERGADEALLLNTNGHVAETASGNVFWTERGLVCTPHDDAGALHGITRGVVRELCGELGLPIESREATASQLQKADGVFVTGSVSGIVPVASLDGVLISSSPLVGKLQAVYQARLK